MKRFAQLYAALDETTKTTKKVAAMAAYFGQVDPADAAWAVFFLSGRKLNRLVKSRSLREWCAEEAKYPDWLFEESYDVVGDLAETISLLLPPPSRETDLPLAEWVERRILPLKKLDEEEQKPLVLECWDELPPQPRFVWNKLVTGSFRVGVSQGLVVKALAAAADLPSDVVAHRLMGSWEPTPEFFRQLVAPDDGSTDRSRPYPFCLAHALEFAPDTFGTSLGPRENYQAEWKWDGIRAQFIRRDGESFLWSRGEELILEKYPELAADAERLPDGTVLDGELLAYADGRVLPFGEMQRRIGRKTVGKKLLAEVPVWFMAFDIMEWDGEDRRQSPLRDRRAKLEEIVDAAEFDRVMTSDILEADSWEALGELRAGSREHQVEGLMLKPLDSPYATGRVTGVWWKWKIEPYTVDAVMIYAQRGHGRRANLYTDFTFAAWDNGTLVPFAKAYSGLTDEEFREVDKFVRRNTVEKFGPVRSVKPELVFELAFENIQESTRHKSGLAVRFPRMVHWRRDKPIEEADSLDRIRAMITPAAETEPVA